MALGYLTLLIGLSISAVAIYYSVLGLVAIFAAATIPIVVMGGVLEVGKLVTAVWLHRYWHRAVWWLKTYLATAVVVLMFITSMGIFGFLSKAHIEQTSAGQESVAQVERLETEIQRQTDIIVRAEEQIKKLETTGTGNDANIQAQIDKEQERIDNAYKRIQPAIDEQNRIIGNQAKLYQDELDRVDEQLSTLQKYIDAGDKESIKKAQAMIGARQDGAWGSRTAAAAEEWRKDRQQARADLLTKIEQATNNPQARAAFEEIKRLRKTVEDQIAQSNKLIDRLRSQLGNTDKAQDIDAQIDEQNLRIKNANTEIDKLTEEKYQIQGEYRKLEAEVGPIKYIAEFIYGDQADTNMLEAAVRWVIIILIFVFDPLAVLLLIASQYTFQYSREDKNNNPPSGGDEDSNPVPPTPGPWPEDKEIENEQDRKEDSENTEERIETPSSPQDEKSIQGQAEADTTVATVEEKLGSNPTRLSSILKKPTKNEEPKYEQDDGPLTEEQINQIQESAPKPSNLEEWNSWVEAANKAAEDEAKEQLEVDGIDLNVEDPDEEMTPAKQAWKQEHPDDTLKRQRRMLKLGMIQTLPWETEEYINKGKKFKIMPELQRYKPNFTEVLEPDSYFDKDGFDQTKGYIQNGEQSDSTLWSKVKRQENNE